MELKGKKINFLGDSITLGGCASSEDKIFHAVLKKNANLAEVRNYGVGRTRIARQSEIKDLVADEDFIMRTDKMSDDADIVVVFGGTNDFGHGQASLGSFEDRTVFTFYGAMHNLIIKLIKKYLGKEIVFITPLHRINEDGQGTWKPEGVEIKPLSEYVKAIKEVCEFYSIPVLDLFSSGSIHGNVAEWNRAFLPDGLHPNDEGHKIIADRLQKFLENL